MNTQPKNKILVIIIAILLIANIATLSLFFINKNQHTKTARSDKRAQITAFLTKDAGFSKEQLDRYDTLSKAHREKVKAIFDDMTIARKGIFKKLAAGSFSDSGMDVAAKSIAEQQNIFEVQMIHHVKDIRNICSPAQLVIFDSGFYKIISKKGESRKEKQ